MEIDYSSYQIDGQYVMLFEKLWSKYLDNLPELPTKIQDEQNSKASVFNMWVNFYKANDYVILKSEKNFLHSYDKLLASRMKVTMTEFMYEVLESNKHNADFNFLYSYILIEQIFLELESFVAIHKDLSWLQLKKYNYYYLNDNDFTASSEIYFILKILSSEFLQYYLTPLKCRKIHQTAWQFAMSHSNQLQEDIVLE